MGLEPHYYPRPAGPRGHFDAGGSAFLRGASGGMPYPSTGGVGGRSPLRKGRPALRDTPCAERPGPPAESEAGLSDPTRALPASGEPPTLALPHTGGGDWKGQPPAEGPPHRMGDEDGCPPGSAGPRGHFAAGGSAFLRGASGGMPYPPTGVQGAGRGWPVAGPLRKAPTILRAGFVI